MIHDVASMGLASRVKSPLNGRIHHLLSQLETDWLYAFHAIPHLLDVREQYPLLGLEETRQIASGLGIAHPAVVSAHACASADPNDRGMMDVVGFDTSAPAVIADFVRGN